MLVTENRSWVRSKGLGRAREQRKRPREFLEVALGDSAKSSALREKAQTQPW